MHKQIPITGFVKGTDAVQLAASLKKELAGKLTFDIGRIHVLAERDSNANRWLVIRLMVKDPNRDL